MLRHWYIKSSKKNNFKLLFLKSCEEWLKNLNGRLMIVRGSLIHSRNKFKQVFALILRELFKNFLFFFNLKLF